MIKIKFPKIKFNRVVLWQILVVAFFVLFVITSLLSAYMFFEMRSEEEVGFLEDQPAVQTVNVRKLESIVVELEKRKEAFGVIILEGKSVADPSI